MVAVPGSQGTGSVTPGRATVGVLGVSLPLPEIPSDRGGAHGIRGAQANGENAAKLEHLHCGEWSLVGPTGRVLISVPNRRTAAPAQFQPDAGPRRPMGILAIRIRLTVPVNRATLTRRDNMMRVAFLVFVLATVAAAQAQPTVADPGGWRAAKWGMNEPDILRAFKGEAVVLAKPDFFSVARAVATIGIDNMEVSGWKFKARFLFDENTRRLVQVIIRPQDEKAELQATDLLYDVLERGLVQKFGTPTHTSARPDHRDAIWVFPSTVVELSGSTTRGLLSDKKLFATVGLMYRDAKAGSDKF